MQEAKLLELMSVDSWFSAMDEGERVAMLASAQLTRLHAGEYLFRKGDGPNGFFGLVSGHLKVSTLRCDGREGILSVVEPGNWFGEACVIAGQGRPHDVMAVGPVELLRIGNEAFDALMHRSGFSHAIAILQARHVLAVYAMLEDATLYSTRARIARRIRRLARGDITMAETDRRIIKLSQDWFAMMLGVSRQTLALELKAMVACGVISIGYGKIIIESMEKLRELEASA